MLGLALYGSVRLAQPVKMKTARAAELDEQALSQPLGSPTPQPAPSAAPVAYVWVPVKKPTPKPTPVPNQPPSLTLQFGAVSQGPERLPHESIVTICSGDTVLLRAYGTDPDGDTLLYSWDASGGRMVSDGSNVEFDTTALVPGEYVVTVFVDDGCGRVASASKTLKVESCKAEPGENLPIAVRKPVELPQPTVGRCARLSAAYRPADPPVRRRIRVPVKAVAPPPPPPTPSPLPSQYREKVAASYPETLEVGTPGQISVEFSSEFVPLAPTPTPTVTVEHGETKATLFPALPGRRADRPLAAEAGLGYSAWIRAELSAEAASGLVLAAQAPEWQELKRDAPETLRWKWSATVNQAITATAAVARLEVEWRKGDKKIRKVLVPRLELAMLVDNPWLSQQELKVATPACYISGASLFGFVFFRRKGRQEEAEETDKPATQPVPVGPPKPAQTADEVECSVYAPAAATRKSSIMVQVFAHLYEQREVVAREATEFDQKASRRVVKTLAGKIERGTQLMFDLQMTGLEIAEPVQMLVWQGRPQAVQFNVKIPPDCAVGDVIGKVTVSYNTIPVGQLMFVLEVKEEAAQIAAADKAGVSLARDLDAHRYQLVFISYASADRTAVLARVQMLEQMGIKYFQDVLSLEPGQRWAQKLYENINQSDLFLLFWSQSAKESEWVMKEVHYALARKGHDPTALPEIKPVIIEGPPLVPPPPELAELHFNDRLIYFMGKK